MSVCQYCKNAATFPNTIDGRWDWCCKAHLVDDKISAEELFTAVNNKTSPYSCNYQRYENIK